VNGTVRTCRIQGRLSGLVLFVLIAFLWSCADEGKAFLKLRADECASLCRGRDWVSLYGLFSDEAKSSLTEEEFVALMRQRWGKHEDWNVTVKLVHVNPRNKSQGMVQLNMSHSRADGRTKTEMTQYQFVNKDSVWYLDFIVK
jgi:hypothetical protein